MATQEATGQAAVGEWQPSLLSTGSWVLYDFANTIYSINVASTFFSLWVTRDQHANDAWYAWPVSISMLLVALISPFMGALSDRGGKRMPWLISLTLICVVAVATIGIVNQLIWGVLAFILANAAYQSSLIYYDAMLPSVSSTSNWGKISGIGVGVGYLGIIVGLLAVQLLFVGTGEHVVNANAFLPTAILFLIFALPCFLFVRERPAIRKTPVPTSINWSGIWTQTWRTVQAARLVPGLWIFLIANFFYSDALNTVITVMSIYAENVLGLSTADRLRFIIGSTVFAVIGSIIFGWVVDRIGAKRSLTISLCFWIVVFLLSLIGVPQAVSLFVVGPLAGIALGSVWVGARTMMIELSPPQQLGEYMGLYNLTGKFAAVLGPLIWGLCLVIFPPETNGILGYRIAIAALLAMILIGLWLHQRTPNATREARSLYLSEPPQPPLS